MIGKRFVARLVVYVVGLFIMAFGVVFSINSDLGISPVNSLPFAVHLASGVGLGICVTLFFLLCIVIQIVLLQKEFKWINLTQIVFSFIFGYFVAIAVFIMGDFTLALVFGPFGLPTYLGQLMMLAISLVLIAAGLSLYLEARLISLPPEGVVLAIVSKLKNGKFHRVKIAMDSILVVLAIAVVLIFTGRIYGVREGTVISAIFIGKLIPCAKRVISYILDKFGFYPKTTGN